MDYNQIDVLESGTIWQGGAGFWSQLQRLWP